ncbi:hypothetical protein Ancab_007793 [Ancistrocladus abbreviatus]
MHLDVSTQGNPMYAFGDMLTLGECAVPVGDHAKHVFIGSYLRLVFFVMEPLACDPSSLPKYPPSKEFDARIREQQSRRHEATEARGKRGDLGKQGLQTSAVSSKANAQIVTAMQMQKIKNLSHSNGQTNRTSSNEVGSENHGPQNNCSANLAVRFPRLIDELEKSRNRDWLLHPESVASLQQFEEKPDINVRALHGCRSKDDQIHFSGPLFTSSKDVNRVLRSHHRRIQEASRRARLEKSWHSKIQPNGRPATSSQLLVRSHGAQ